MDPASIMLLHSSVNWPLAGGNHLTAFLKKLLPKLGFVLSFSNSMRVYVIILMAISKHRGCLEAVDESSFRLINGMGLNLC